jgi:2-dehydropantoate 2-reductase
LRIAVLGAGALGSLFAEALSRVAEVEIVDRTTAPPRDMPPVEIVLVCVKSPGTAWAAEVAARILAPSGVAVTLQNGLGHVDVLAHALGPARSAQGVTSEGARWEGDRLIRAGQGITHLAPHDRDAASRPLLVALASLLEQAGFPARVSDDARSLVWRKLVANAAINPLTALLRITNGELLEHKAAATADAIAREVAAVACASGVAISAHEAPEIWRQVARTSAANRSSMLQDMERGKATEIDAICGAVAREGQRVGVPTPLCSALATLLP